MRDRLVINALALGEVSDEILCFNFVCGNEVHPLPRTGGESTQASGFLITVLRLEVTSVTSRPRHWDSGVQGERICHDAMLASATDARTRTKQGLIRQAANGSMRDEATPRVGIRHTRLQDQADRAGRRCGSSARQTDGEKGGGEAEGKVYDLRAVDVRVERGRRGWGARGVRAGTVPASEAGREEEAGVFGWGEGL